MYKVKSNMKKFTRQELVKFGDYLLSRCKERQNNGVLQAYCVHNSDIESFIEKLKKEQSKEEGKGIQELDQKTIDQICDMLIKRIKEEAAMRKALHYLLCQ